MGFYVFCVADDAFLKGKLGHTSQSLEVNVHA